ncbi:MAG: DUF1289 domain-containing protein [Pseudomonadales bacterium]|nr:DUF1289 domain-containing protein [Pseudomonadales bacterium]
MKYRQTPCLGVCSTTYGDLVCRGCKRFSHEITGWNGFDQDQQSRVWLRLELLRDQCVSLCLCVKDIEVLRTVIAAKNIPVWKSSSELTLAYQAIRFYARSNSPVVRSEIAFESDLQSLGLDMIVGVRDEIAGSHDPFAEMCRLIDDEFYMRSRAYYERNFKVPLHT